ncbi:CorA family divalent cation transporter [Nocardia noduli]|uniref:CorA family divalent cation transporter n=1 Tax=Nocardia noduli TaxID=2815722 RepID=UPI001C23F71A|nr:CorA family divalent cation transporter [Nocardia noduli]
MRTPTAPAADHFDTEVLGKHWIPLSMTDAETAVVLRERLGVDFPAARERDWAADDFLYVPVVVNHRLGDGDPVRDTIVFAVNEEFLVTWQPTEPFVPFDAAIAKMSRDPLLTGSSYGVMYALLWALNDGSREILCSVDATLASVRADLAAASTEDGRRDRGGVTGELRGVPAALDAVERAVAPVRETQRHLARAAHRMRGELAWRAGELDGRTIALVADIDSVEKYAAAEYDTLRYLQHSLRSRLDVERNRLVEILTLLAAVCLPPTLISTFVHAIGMPDWEFGYLAATAITVASAVIPFVYVVRRIGER